MKILSWLPLALALVLFELIGCNRSLAAFIPPESYLIACGSSRNVTSQGRTFVPDSGHLSITLGTGTSVVAVSNSDFPSHIYQFARVFSGTAS